MSEQAIVVYRSRMEAAQDAVLFDLMSSEWAFPIIVAVLAAVGFYAFMSGIIERHRRREILKIRPRPGSMGERQQQLISKVHAKWNWIQYGSTAAVFGLVLFLMMHNIS